jgi:hypothetical protein
MHIHGANTNSSAINLHSSGNDMRAVAAQRAAEVRKRLLKNGQSVESELSPDQVSMVRQWLSNRSGQGKNDDRNASGGNEPEFG